MKACGVIGRAVPDRYALAAQIRNAWQKAAAQVGLHGPCQQKC